MKGFPILAQQEFKIKYYHAAKRYLYERGPVGYVSAGMRELERLAEVLRYEDYRRHIQPYLKQKECLLNNFYDLQIRPSAPMPEWLQEALSEWDDMIAIEARKFGYEPSVNGTGEL